MCWDPWKFLFPLQLIYWNVLWGIWGSAETSRSIWVNIQYFIACFHCLDVCCLFHNERDHLCREQSSPSRPASKSSIVVSPRQVSSLLLYMILLRGFASANMFFCWFYCFAFHGHNAKFQMSYLLFPEGQSNSEACAECSLGIWWDSGWLWTWSYHMCTLSEVVSNVFAVCSQINYTAGSASV